MKNEPSVITVSQLNLYLKSILEYDDNLSHVFLRGEISNFTNHIRSGHYYFSLKDEKSVIKAVMFRNSNQRLKFMPQDGMKVIAAGRVGVYERDGVYQLYVEDMQPDGIGALHLAFEQLKERLEKEGLFSPERKKAMPRYPERIGVITSPTGAAVRDIQNILSRRFPVAKMILFPVLVQGGQAPGQIADAIRKMNRAHMADVLIVGRGGGSLEELWAFNDEIVVRAIAESQIPVISAVGHETDVSLSDFAADLRAPTPSAAAELAVPDRWELLAGLDGYLQQIKNITRRHLGKESERLAQLVSRPVFRTPQYWVDEKKLRLDGLLSRMESAFQHKLEKEKYRLSAQAGRLHALSPLHILARGYSIVYHEERVVFRSDQLQKGDLLKIRISDGILETEVKKIRREIDRRLRGNNEKGNDV